MRPLHIKSFFQNNRTIIPVMFLILFLAAQVKIYSQCTYTVTDTTDDVFSPASGSLRWAINQANNTAPGSTICFNLPSPYIITLDASLPPIDSSMTIDGSTQPGYSINQNPLVIIDANNDSINIFTLSVSAPGAEIKGLLLRNISDVSSSFGDYPTAIYVAADYVKVTNCMFNKIGQTSSGYFPMPVAVTGDRAIIKGNILGTDINGTNSSNLKNFSGIYLWSSADNTTIGGLATNEGNIIAFASAGNYYGITVDGGSYNRISGNHIFGFPTAINLVLNNPGGEGNLAKPAPVITSAKVNLSGVVNIKGTASANDVIEIFGSTGSQNANEYLTTVSADGSGNWSTTINNVSWPNLTATATDQVGSNSPNLENTSQLSNSILITDCCSSAPVLNISGFYAGSGNW